MQSSLTQCPTQNNCQINRRTEAFELRCWRRLWSPLDCKENQSVLKEINPEYSLEGLMLKVKLQ